MKCEERKRSHEIFEVGVLEFQVLNKSNSQKLHLGPSCLSLKHIEDNMRFQGVISQLF